MIFSQRIGDQLAITELAVSEFILPVQIGTSEVLCR